jgi:GDP-L-fucose synthase
MVGRNILEDTSFKKIQILTPHRKDLDLSAANSVLEYLKDHRPEFIIHCAGRVGGIQANMSYPVEFLVENLDIGRNLVMGAYRTGIKKLINIGSSCMYPRNAPQALTEDMILKGELEPTNEGYAIAKIATQRLCAYIRQENPEFLYKTLIPSNLYGRHDKFSPEHSHMVPAVIRKIHQAKIKNLDEVEIWGDGHARREFMYCGDLVDCIYKTLQDFESVPDLMNVGLGHDYSVNEYYQVAAEVIGYKGRFVHNLEKPVGMKQKLTSVKRANEWGWKSSTNMQTGIAQTYHYFLNSVVTESERMS